MTDPVFIWWTVLCVISAANVLGWTVSGVALGARQQRLSPSEYALRRWLLILSAGYVLGCAYRSVLPVFDVPRQVMFDSWWSSVAMGRSVATIAELCFVAQWALLLRESSRATGSTFGAPRRGSWCR